MAVQLRVTTTFLSLALVMLFAQFFLSFHALQTVAAETPELEAQIPAIAHALMREWIIVTILTVPLVLSIGVLTTFKLAGPVAAVTTYLRRVAGGGEIEPIALRDGDALEELADAVNHALDDVRNRGAQIDRPLPKKDAPVSTSEPAAATAADDGSADSI